MLLTAKIIGYYYYQDGFCFENLNQYWNVGIQFVKLDILVIRSKIEKEKIKKEFQRRFVWIDRLSANLRSLP